MASTSLVLRTNDTSPQLYFHDGQNIDPTGLGALPGAALEDLTAFGGARQNVKQNNRVFTLLNRVFAIQDSKIYVSTDEAATFVLDFTFTGASANTWEAQNLGPVPVMVQGALKLVGFYMSGADIYVFEYDVATNTWTDADTGVDCAGQTAGMTVPVVYNGLVYARVGDTFIAYDPVSTGTVTITSTGLTDLGADQMIAWNGALWCGPVGDVTANIGMAKLTGSTFSVDTGGVDLTGLTAVSTTSKSAVFIDPNNGNLIVLCRKTDAQAAYSITSGLAVTPIVGSVAGTNMAAIGAFGAENRYWPHITRAPGGTYTVEIYASRGPNTSDPIERFTWVNDMANFTELGVVGGTGDMAFPYAIHGGDYNGFFPAEKRVMQTAQVTNPTGITVTCETYQQGGTTVSVRGHYDKVGATPNSLTLAPMSIGNPAGDPGLSIAGSNPGVQIDGVPANLTPITFDWDQVSDGFATGDNYNFQLEAF